MTKEPKFPVDRSAWIEKKTKERDENSQRANKAARHGDSASANIDTALLALRSRTPQGFKTQEGADYIRKAIVELNSALKALEASDAHRMLAVGEVILPGDEIRTFEDREEWEKVKHLVGSKVGEEDLNNVRRHIAK